MAMRDRELGIARQRKSNVTGRLIHSFCGLRLLSCTFRAWSTWKAEKGVIRRLTHVARTLHSRHIAKVTDPPLPSCARCGVSYGVAPTALLERTAGTLGAHFGNKVVRLSVISKRRPPPSIVCLGDGAQRVDLLPLAWAARARHAPRGPRAAVRGRGRDRAGSRAQRGPARADRGARS